MPHSKIQFNERFGSPGINETFMNNSLRIMISPQGSVGIRNEGIGSVRHGGNSVLIDNESRNMRINFTNMIGNELNNTLNSNQMSRQGEIY